MCDRCSCAGPKSIGFRKGSIGVTAARLTRSIMHDDVAEAWEKTDLPGRLNSSSAKVQFRTCVWSIKYRLKKLIAQIVTTLRDEFFKPN